MKLTKAERAHVHAKYDGHCAYCGVVLGKLWHADHLEAIQRKLKYVQGVGLRPTGEVYKPENHRLDNMMPSCPPCNISKHSDGLEYWRRRLADAPNVMARNHKTYRMALAFGLLAETDAPVVFYFERVAAARPAA